MHGCDFNRRLVGWCRRHLRFGRFQVNALRPPLPYPDGRFDLVYALSVFTHLPEDLQGPWMDELGRVLAPGGHVILSVHGRRYVDELSPAERERFEAGRLVVRQEGPAGTNVYGAYHPFEYVAKRWPGRSRWSISFPKALTATPVRTSFSFADEEAGAGPAAVMKFLRPPAPEAHALY